MPEARLRTELRLTYAALALTLILTGLALTPVAELLARHAADGRAWAVAAVALFLILVLILLYGGLVYQLARVGYLKGQRAYRPVTAAAIERMLWGESASPP